MISDAERLEQIWQIVNKLTYAEFRAMQKLFQPLDQDEED